MNLINYDTGKERSGGVMIAVQKDLIPVIIQYDDSTVEQVFVLIESRRGFFVLGQCTFHQDQMTYRSRFHTLLLRGNTIKQAICLYLEITICQKQTGFGQISVVIV